MLTPERMLAAYRRGNFPMARSRDDESLFWVAPDMRGVFPLDNFHISRSLSRDIRRLNYTIRTNSAFGQVVDLCAGRPETWINPALHRLYRQLHAMHHAHSLEVWVGDDLAGGVFGVSLGAAFFGESMFSRRTNASKIALAYLVDRLRLGGFRLFDTQFLTSHLASLGAVEIPREEYLRQLRLAVNEPADFNRAGCPPSPQLLLQRKTQRS